MANPKADTANTATGPATMTVQEGVASLLQGDADRRKADTRRSVEPDPSEVPAYAGTKEGAQGPDPKPDDTGDDEPTVEEDEEAEPADEDQPEDEREEEPAYVVKVDGREHKVTLDELLKGYSRQSDYTRRTQALAEQAKQVEETRARAAAEREQYRQALEIIHRGLTENAEPMPDEHTDPLGYALAEVKLQKRKERAEQVAAEHARLTQQQIDEQKAALNAYAETQRTQLVEKIPLWRDPAKASLERQALRSYAMNVLGYTDQEVAQAYDHRLIVMLRKAWLYDRINAKGSLADKRVRTAPAEIPSRARVMEGSQGRAGSVARAKQLKQLEKTGDIRDAVSLLLME